MIQTYQCVSIPVEEIDAVLSSCCSVSPMRALILLAKGKRPEAVLDVAIIPSVGAQMTVAGTV
jgi:hypothetical protein